jgi:hypothetical protein
MKGAALAALFLFQFGNRIVSLRPGAATDLHDHLNWNFYWSAREKSHDDAPRVLAMLDDPAVA